MTTAAPVQPGTTQMPEEKRFPAVLIGFMVLSLLAHAATFFLFQVTYPPHVTIPPQPTQVILLAGQNPEEQALLRWVESEDPALIAASAHPVPAALFEVPYQPSYKTSRTAPRSMPIVPEPPARAPGPSLPVLLRSAAPPPPTQPPISRPIGTRLRLAGDLAGWGTDAAGTTFHPPAGLSLEEPSAFLGVGSDGVVRYCVLQKSSGDPATDKAWQKHLAQLRFPPREDAGLSTVTWGFAYLSWGDDGALPTSTPR